MPSLAERLARGARPMEVRVLGVLALVGLAVALLVTLAPTTVPFTSLMVPLLLGSLLLTPRQVPWFVAWVLVLLLFALSRQEELTTRVLGAAGVQVLMCAIVLAFSVRRARLGVGAGRGESMFVDLRDRILGQGGIPDLPGDWYAASALRSAGGTAFAGDFVVAARPAPDRLEVAVVDVSGKGEGAGTRALLLSGALGGLLGAMSPEDFLESANTYLMRQDWEEGFATAVHLSLNLRTGEFEVRSAGHPPAALRAAGSGRWSALNAEGPVLGLIDHAVYEPVRGTMRRGDALLLYTDGMVETRDRDVMLGVDKVLGRAELLLRGDFDGGAKRLIEAIGSRNDDRALLLVHRR